MPRKHLILLAVFCLPLFFLKIGSRDLWAPDEPRFAQVAQEMLGNGNWIVPTMNGEKIALLPPFTYWSIAASSLPSGRVNEYSARFPMALAGLLTVLATYLLARRMFDPETALISALILSTTAGFAHQAGWIQSDIWLICFTTIACASFSAAYTSPEKRNRYLLLFYIACALGTLTKGPLGVGLPGLVIVTFLIWQRDWNYPLRMGLLWGIPLYLLIVLPWYIAVAMQGGKEFAEELILKHNFGMFYESWSHKQPVYYYLLYLPLAAMPWILFLPGTIFHLRSLDDRYRSSLRFLMVWTGALFVFFSMASAKQMKYILPLIPAMSIAIACFIHHLRERGSRYFLQPMVALAVMAVLTLAGIGALLLRPELAPKIQNRYPDIPASLMVPAILLAGGMLVSVVMYFRKKPIASFLCMAAALTVCVAALRFTAFPAVNRHKSARPLCERAIQETKNGEPLGIYGIHFRQIGAYVFYTGRKLQTFENSATNEYRPNDFLSFMNSPGRVVCMIEKDEYDWLLTQPAGAAVKTLDRRNIGSNIVFLISNR